MGIVTKSFEAWGGRDRSIWQLEDGGLLAYRSEMGMRGRLKDADESVTES